MLSKLEMLRLRKERCLVKAAELQPPRQREAWLELAKTYQIQIEAAERDPAGQPR
jgi:hypothetical protein